MSGILKVHETQDQKIVKIRKDQEITIQIDHHQLKTNRKYTKKGTIT